MSVLEIIAALAPLEVEALQAVRDEIDKLLGAKSPPPAEPPIAPQVAQELDAARAKMEKA